MEWQVATFPTSTELSKLHHLSKEVIELIEEVKSDRTRDEQRARMEYADCFILLFGAAGLYGYSVSDIETMMKEKMEINKKRKWGIPDEKGVVLHEKE